MRWEEIMKGGGRCLSSRDTVTDGDSGHWVGAISLSNVARHGRGARAAETLRQVLERDVRA